MKKIALSFILALFLLVIVGCSDDPTPVVTEGGEPTMEIKSILDIELTGKNVVALGTEISSPADSYLGMLQAEYGFNLTNLSSTSLTSISTNAYAVRVGVDVNTHINHILFNNIEAVSDADVFIFELGTNDFHFSAPLGTIEDQSIGTFYGGINSAIETIKALNPDFKVIFMTPTYRVKKTTEDRLKNETGNIILDYRDAVIKLAIHHDAYLVDNYYLFDVSNSSQYLNGDGLTLRPDGQKAVKENFVSNIVNVKDCETISDVYSLLISEDNLLNPINMSGKKVVFYGDSITARAGIKDDEIHFTDILAAKTGLTYNNFAIGGTTYAKYNEWAAKLLPSLVNSYAVANIRMHANYNAEADIIFMLYGTNDWNFGLELGELGTNDENTFIGAMQKSIDTLKQQNPGVTIVVATPVARSSGSENPYPGTTGELNVNGHSLDDFRNAIIQVAQLNDVYICRLDRLWVNSEFTSDIGLDPVHPNVTGSAFMGEYLIFNTKKASEVETIK